MYLVNLNKHQKDRMSYFQIASTTSPLVFPPPWWLFIGKSECHLQAFVLMSMYFYVKLQCSPKLIISNCCIKMHTVLHLANISFLSLCNLKMKFLLLSFQSLFIQW